MGSLWGGIRSRSGPRRRGDERTPTIRVARPFGVPSCRIKTSLSEQTPRGAFCFLARGRRDSFDGPSSGPRDLTRGQQNQGPLWRPGKTLNVSSPRFPGPFCLVACPPPSRAGCPTWREGCPRAPAGGRGESWGAGGRGLPRSALFCKGTVSKYRGVSASQTTNPLPSTS